MKLAKQTIVRYGVPDSIILADSFYFHDSRTFSAALIEIRPNVFKGRWISTDRMLFYWKIRYRNAFLRRDKPPTFEYFSALFFKNSPFCHFIVELLNQSIEIIDMLTSSPVPMNLLKHFTCAFVTSNVCTVCIWNVNVYWFNFRCFPFQLQICSFDWYLNAL